MIKLLLSLFKKLNPFRKKGKSMGELYQDLIEQDDHSLQDNINAEENWVDEREVMNRLMSRQNLSPTTKISKYRNDEEYGLNIEKPKPKKEE